MENSIGINIGKEKKVINSETSRKSIPVKKACRNNSGRSNTGIIEYKENNELDNKFK